MNRTLDARIVVVALGLAGAALLLAAPVPLQADDAPAPASTPATEANAAPASGFVGSESCLKCHEHEAKSKDFQLTLHGKSRLEDWTGATDCETCHGPGEAHVKGKGRTEGMIDPSDMPKHELNAMCLKCHDSSQHVQWEGGAHDGRGMSCLTCHQIHPKKGEIRDALLIRSNTFETCTTCHLQKKATLVRSSHMPLREGQMTCTTCHEPHGSPGPAQLRQLSVNDNCYSCHAEKRSPNLWEHPPVKENCLNCHDPHGSLHPNLLKARIPRLCQQCHDEARHPTQPYDSAQTLRNVGNQPLNDGSFFPGTRLINHGCANCHSNIHGSNHPSGVRFMR